MRTSSLTWSPIPNNSLQLLNAELRLANSQIRIERYIKRMLLHIYNVRLVFYHRLGNMTSAQIRVKQMGSLPKSFKAIWANSGLSMCI
ncbi:hypothetical protein YC2023_113357 [Brassica napus]